MKNPALVDANVVLRFLLDDDPRQSPDAAALFAHAPAASLSLSPLTLAEVAWVLQSHYQVPRDQVALALQRVLAQTSVVSDAFVTEAVTRFALNRVDFADCYLAAQAAHARATIITFDQDFRRFQDVAAVNAKAGLSHLRHG